MSDFLIHIKKSLEWHLVNSMVPVGTYLFKANDENTRVMCKIC